MHGLAMVGMGVFALRVVAVSEGKGSCDRRRAIAEGTVSHLPALTGSLAGWKAYVAEIHVALHATGPKGKAVQLVPCKTEKLVPTHYYGGPGKSKFVLTEHPWLPSVTDGVLFYFMNMKGGQKVCETTPLCGKTKPPKKCGFKCLFGSCAEASSPFLADEIGDFAAALPAGHPIHIGVYWSGYSSCGTPSPKYNWDSFVTALALPSVAGVTVYADLVSTYKHKGQYKDCLMVKNGSVIPLSIDKGCLVKHPLSVMCVCAESSAERRLYVRMYTCHSKA